MSKLTYTYELNPDYNRHLTLEELYQFVVEVHNKWDGTSAISPSIDFLKTSVGYGMSEHDEVTGISVTI